MIFVKPEVGGIAICIQRIGAIQDFPHVDVRIGKIEWINKMGHTKIYDCDAIFPIYRIEKFTFGGVMVNNPRFDINRIIKEYLDKGGTL